MAETGVTNGELDDLQDGLTGRFWQSFVDHATKEWGAAGERYQAAVETAAMKADDASCRAMLQMTIFAKKEIERLLQWPAERVSQLQQQARSAAGTGPSRRGGL